MKSHLAERSQQLQKKELSRLAPHAESRRRRHMTFMKVGYDERRSSATLDKTREHARKLALTFSQDTISPAATPTSASFADFGNAFGGDPFSSFNADFPPSSDSFDTSFFDQSNFPPESHEISRKPASSSRRRQSSVKNNEGSSTSHELFAVQWPLEGQSMHTLPANSTMQTSYAQHRSQGNSTSGPRTPVRRPEAVESSPATSGGAAARRRMRKQMKFLSVVRSESDMVHTPPQSPHSIKRYQSSDSVGSSSRGGKTTDHVVHYSMTQRAPIGSATVSSGNRSISSANRSVASSNSSSGVNLFDSEIERGFTFDAFGLDASQINREVNEAMNDLAGSHPDLSLFADHDQGDDFAVSRWDSPVGSRASTPCPEEDGFVDGFRVAKTSALPVHIRQSPTSTDRSSLTSESSDRHAHDGQVNRFKQQAGFQASKARKIVRPAESSTLREKGYSFQVSPRKVPKIPDLEVGQRLDPRKQNENVEFFDFDDSSSDDSVNATGATAPRSDAGVPSDVGVASDLGCSSDFAVKSVIGPIPLEVKSKGKMRSTVYSDSTASTTAASTHEDEEKKEGEDVAEPSEDEPKPEPEKLVGSLRSKWESQNLVSSTQSAVKKPESRQVASLSREHIDRIQSQLGEEILSPEKLQNKKLDFKSYQKQRSDECLEQRTSFGSMKERLRSSSLPRKDIQPATKSEGGAAIRHSHVSSVLTRMEAQTPRDAKSDIVESPSFLAVRLRKTGIIDQQFTTESSASAHLVSSLQNILVDEKAEFDKKLTYRERRELELQHEREEKERRQAHAEALPQRDVAAEIKRRIAENKRSSPVNTLLQPDYNQISSQTSASASSSEIQEEGRTHTDVDFAQQEPLISPSRRRDSNLVIESSKPKECKKVEASPAVSRMLMLQQLQQVRKTVETTSPAAAPKSLTISTSEANRAPSDSGHKGHKGSTPKATMMMLNAFLAGRDSIGGGDGPGSTAGEASKASEDGDRFEAARGVCSSLPALKDDPKYETYFRMLKLGMPMEVVKHAMTRDGLDPSVMDGDHNKPVGVPLKDDPLFAKYFKMLSIGLPMDAVKHSMERDGLDSSVMDQDHNQPLQKKVATNAREEPKEKDSHRRARLHWNILRKVTSNSLWAKIDEDDALDHLEIDEKEFQELFQKELGNEMEAKTTTREPTKRGATVRVIDPKRANNGGIILARLKMTHDDMADAVDRIDEHAMTAEQIENMVEYLPTKEERKALEAYMLEGGQDAAEKFDSLCECEKFMVSMMTVSHAKRKVRALLFKLQFESCFRDIHHDTMLIESACDELVNSVRLRQLLGIVLEFGNRLNTAGKGDQRKAGAFTLDSLLKLNQAKAFDKKTTFLHYIVLIVQRNNEILLRFKDDLPTVFKADKVYWDQCVSDLEEVENQLENVRRIALYQARQTNHFRLRRKKHKEDDEESLSDGDMSLTLEEEVEMLRATPIGMFTLSAIKYVSALRDKVDETKRKFERLKEYFGEEEKTSQPHEIFNTIATFSRDFDKAKEQVFTNEKRKLREERKKQATSANKSLAPGIGIDGRPPTYSPAPSDRKQENQLLKTSNLQPTLGNVLKELTTRSPPLNASQGASNSTAATALQNGSRPPVTYDSSLEAPKEEIARVILESHSTQTGKNRNETSSQGISRAFTSSPKRRSQSESQELHRQMLTKSQTEAQSEAQISSREVRATQKNPFVQSEPEVLSFRMLATPHRNSSAIEPHSPSVQILKTPKKHVVRGPEDREGRQDESVSSPAVSTKQPSPSSGRSMNSSKLIAMRQKARMQRQRVVQNMSCQPDTVPNDAAAPAQSTQTEARGDSEVLSPRAHIRNKMRMERQRQQLRQKSFQ